MSTSTPGISPDVAALTTDVAELKDMMKTFILDKQKSQAPVTLKAIDEKYDRDFNPTLYYDPNLFYLFFDSHPFRISDFLSKIDAFLAIEDDPTSPEVDDSYYDPEGDILLLEVFLSDDPSLPPPT
ncbi:hypothetical protein Tco_0486867 [Tanacetum coccineum]